MFNAGGYATGLIRLDYYANEEMPRVVGVARRNKI